MKTLRILSFSLLVAVVLPLSGCVYGDPEIEDMLVALEDELYPARLSARHEFRVGSSILNLGAMAIGWADADDEEIELAQHLLRDLDQIHVGAYDIRGRGWDDPPLQLSEEWRLELAREGWQVIVRVQEYGDEAQWVLARLDGRTIDGVYVVSVEDREMVVVKLEGDLSRTIDYAVRRDGGFMVAMREAGGEH